MYCDTVRSQAHDTAKLGARRSATIRPLRPRHGTGRAGELSARRRGAGCSVRGTARRARACALQYGRARLRHSAGGRHDTAMCERPGRACAGRLGVLAGSARVCAHCAVEQFLDSVLFLSHFLGTVHHKKFSRKIK